MPEQVIEQIWISPRFGVLSKRLPGRIRALKHENREFSRRFAVAGKSVNHFFPQKLQLGAISQDTMFELFRKGDHVSRQRINLMGQLNRGGLGKPNFAGWENETG